MIQRLRAEIGRAMEEGRDEALRFELGTIEVELELAVTREADTNVGVKFWVLDAGASGKLGSERTQKLKLSLTPRFRDGSVVQISKPAARRRG
jgi:hypothetical protein